MKKIITLIMVVAMVFGTASLSFAASSMKDNELSERVATRIESIYDGEKEVDYIVDTYRKTDVVSVNSGARQIETEYCTTEYEVWRLSYNGSTENNGTDSTISVRFTTKIYYTDTFVGNVTYRQMTRIEGGYSIIDQQMSVTDQSLLVGQFGPSQGGGDSANNTKYYYPTSASWSYTIPAVLFPGIMVESSESIQGVHYYYTIQRVTGSSWSGDFHTTTLE